MTRSVLVLISVAVLSSVGFYVYYASTADDRENWRLEKLQTEMLFWKSPLNSEQRQTLEYWMKKRDLRSVDEEIMQRATMADTVRFKVKDLYPELLDMAFSPGSNSYPAAYALGRIYDDTIVDDILAEYDKSPLLSRDYHLALALDRKKSQRAVKELERLALSPDAEVSQSAKQALADVEKL